MNRFHDLAHDARLAASGETDGYRLSEQAYAEAVLALVNVVMNCGHAEAPYEPALPLPPDDGGDA